MRVSIIGSDPGYVQDAYNYEVKLNGTLLKYCFTADEEKGEAHCYKTNWRNKLIIDDSGDSIATEILHGIVEIIKPVKNDE